MTHKIKSISIAFAAVAAMSAFAVSAAQGSELHASTAGGANITGQQEPGAQLVFRYTGHNGETKCTQATFEGTANDEVTGDGQKPHLKS
jgi:hypothetical protein